MICKKCGKTFPSSLIIDGKRRALNKRKYCLECSPFGEHNTSKLERTKKCSQCGETDPSKFSKNNYKQCKACKAKYNKGAGKSKQGDIIKYLGGKCRHCGYSEYEASFDIHHLNPSLKDRNFQTHRYWKWSRIVEELETCILLCKNCHAAYHANLIDNKELIKISLPDNIDDIREELKQKYVDIKKNKNKSRARKLKTCLHCGKEFIPSKNKQKYCSETCAKLASRKVERPSYEQILNDLETLKNNFCAVGRKYGVSDNAVRKWIEQYLK